MAKEKKQELKKVDKKELDSLLTKILSVPPPLKTKTKKKRSKRD